MAAKATDLKQRLSDLKNARSTWESHWQEIVEYILPFRQGITTKDVAGTKKMTQIFDSTATHALQLFAAGLCSRLTNASLRWFRVMPENYRLAENKRVKMWLEEVEQIYNIVFNKSNFYTAIHESYIDEAAFGTSAMYIGVHPRWKAYFDTLNLAECYVALNQYGQIDTVFREYEMTARAMQQKWGNKISDKAKAHLESNKPDENVMVLHAVYPRKDRDTAKVDNRDMKWAEVYMEPDGEHIINESGYKEFPYCISRYFVASGEVYGRGPGMIALPDVKMLQQMEQDILKAGQKKLSPPILLPSDGFLGPIKLTPNGINFYRGDAAMQEKIGVFPAPEDLGYAEEKLEQKRNQIGRIFFNDLMLLAQDKEMTATEFVQVAQEKMQMLGPFLGRLQTEKFNPLFDRVFNILWDAGEIPPPPMELIRAGGGLRIDYISPLAKAQKNSENRGIMQTFGFVGQIAAVTPDILDVMDWDESVRRVGENSGMPQTLIRSPEDVAGIRQMRQKKQQAMEMAQMMQEAGKTVPALSKGPEPGSPMEQINQALQQGAGNA